MARNLIPESRAYRRAAGMLCPQARMSVCGWWNQIVTEGLIRRMSRTAARVSGSESGRGPGYSGSHRRPPALHSDGKLRFRSTPRPFCRRPRAKPSGLRLETTQRSTAGDERARIRVTAVPAHSSPWMQPTTSARVGLVVSPRRIAVIGSAPRGSADLLAPLRIRPDADVQVVVVVDERLDDPPWPAQADPRPDEDVDGAGLHETRHEVLRERAIDQSGPAGPELLPVAPRVVDVDVEPVLVRGVPPAAEALVEDAAVGPRQIADAHAGRLRVGNRVLVEDTKHDAEQAIVSPAPPPSVRRALLDRVPREEMLTFGRELDAPDEPSVPRNPERARVSPLDRLVGTAPERCRSERSRRHREDQGDAGQHQLTLSGNAFSIGLPSVSTPNCWEMFDTACTFAAAKRKKSHWSAFTQPTRSHFPFGETASDPKSPGAEYRNRASPGFASADSRTRSLRPVAGE